ncbi:MAG TPA: hypothetical protein EYO53_06175 [Alphaproteobacteria bacterium]|nr:hypothetical protein [Alphaproteobacteria bacterium]
MAGDWTMEDTSRSVSPGLDEVNKGFDRVLKEHGLEHALNVIEISFEDDPLHPDRARALSRALNFRPGPMTLV